MNNEPVLLFDEIPQTIQNQTVKRHKPKNPQIYISEEVEAFELLEDVNISINTSDQNDNNSSVSTDQSNVKTMQSVPRLIFEVIPADGNNEFKGKLQLSLKINKKGQVVDGVRSLPALSLTPANPQSPGRAPARSVAGYE